MSDEPMAVERITTTSESHIEPPLNQAWSPHDRLRWNAGVALADAGLLIRVHQNSRGRFSLYGNNSHTTWSNSDVAFYDCWRTITAMTQGARLALDASA